MRAIAGVIVGVPVLRLKGDYLAIVTLAFGEIIKNLVNVMYLGLDEPVCISAWSTRISSWATAAR